MTRDRVVIGAAMPALVLRIAGVAVVAAVALILQPALFWQILFVAVAVVGAIFPRTGLAWGGLIIAPLSLVTDDISLGHTALALAAVHLGHALASLNLVIPAFSRVSLAALVPTARRFIAVQVISQVLVAAVLLVPRAEGSGLAWAAPVGAVGVALLVLLLLRRAT